MELVKRLMKNYNKCSFGLWATCTQVDLMRDLLLCFAKDISSF